MSSIGYVSTQTYKNQPGLIIPKDESICGFLFDISSYSDTFEDYMLLYEYLKDDNVVLINNIKEAESLGITEDGFADGNIYYHIKQYYEFLGYDQELYICLSNCQQNGSPDFSVIEKMVIESGSKIFQIGVWTKQSLWAYSGANFSNAIHNIGSVSKLISPSNGYVSSISIIVSAMPSSDGNYNINYKNVVNCTDFNYPKVSILLGQKSGDTYKRGILGKTMACLTLCGAEDTIAYVNKFNINKFDDIDDVSLGFGNNNTPISEINSVQLDILSQKGYIFPIYYDEKPGGVYFNGDSTMSSDDYNTIRANRVIHKFRRVIKQAVLPYINRFSNINNSYDTEINNTIIQYVKAYMINNQGKSQILDYMVNISDVDNILNSDAITIDIKVALIAPSNIIIFEESLSD